MIAKATDGSSSSSVVFLSSSIENVLKKMGELAEKYHQEKEKNRQLLSELKRMNDTLSRFESRISVLGREKKTLESEIDKMKEK